MQSAIGQIQNSSEQLERLAAQRYLYSVAKRFLTVQLLLDLVSPVVLAVVIAIFPDVAIYGAFIALLILVSDFYLESLQSAKKEDAAAVQELFDCEVLSLECHELIAREIPDTIEIMEAAEKYKRADPTYKELKNWYPVEVDTLPPYLARLVCQRINCLWDVQLRRKYLQVVGMIFFLLCAVVVMISLLKGLTFGNFLLIVVFPLLPAMGWIIRELRGQNEAIQRKDGLKRYTEEVWSAAIRKRASVEEIERNSRKLQDKIYDNRCHNPLILDAFYRHLRPRNEVQMTRSAEELVKEALQCLEDNSKP